MKAARFIGNALNAKPLWTLFITVLYLGISLTRAFPEMIENFAGEETFSATKGDEVVCVCEE